MLRIGINGLGRICTTQCLAPVARVLHDGIGIERGSVTTMHAPPNTQTVQDLPMQDPRRARAAQLSLILPTTTNSAWAVALIIPELRDRLAASRSVSP